MTNDSGVWSWFKYSGLSLIVSLNPMWWRPMPWYRREASEWAGPNERTYSIGWLFLTVRIWIDDGKW